MIIDVLVRPIRKRDRDGNLSAAGVQWVEMRMWFILLMAVFMVPGFFIGAGGTIMRLGNKASDGSFLAAVLGGIVFFGGMFIVVNFGKRKRSLLFQADGSILAPQGIPGTPQFVLKHTGFIGHAQIRSIEVGQDPKHGIDVRLYSSEGDKIVVARQFFEPDFARKIAVQLQKALQDIRRGYSDDLDDEVAGIDLNIRAATANARRGETVDIVID